MEAPTEAAASVATAPKDKRPGGLVEYSTEEDRASTAASYHASTAASDQEGRALMAAPTDPNQPPGLTWTHDVRAVLPAGTYRDPRNDEEEGHSVQGSVALSFPTESLDSDLRKI